MAKTIVLLSLLLFITACLPVPLSFVDIRKQTKIGFIVDDAAPKKETVSFTMDEPGIFFQPTLRISGQNVDNVAMSLQAVSNEEISVRLSIEMVKLSSYGGFFPPFIPLFPYMRETLIPSRRDENLKVRVLYFAEKPLENNYHFTNLYLEDGIKRIYPLEQFNLNIAKGKKAFDQILIEFPITNREAEDKILRLETIKSDRQTFAPVSGKLKLYKSWDKEWMFFGGFICINC